MKKKNFRLQKILEYRERIVELEKNKLAELNVRLSSTNNKIMTVDAEITKQVNDKETAETIYKVMYDKYIKKLTDEKKRIDKGEETA